MEIIVPVFGRCALGVEFWRYRCVDSALIPGVYAQIGVFFNSFSYMGKVIKKKNLPNNICTNTAYIHFFS